MSEGSSLPCKGRAEKLPSAASDDSIWPYIMKTMSAYSEALCTTLATIQLCCTENISLWAMGTVNLKW